MKNVLTTMTLTLVVILALGCGPKSGDKADTSEGATGEKVTLDFHIMSKCPYGVKVLQGISPVLEKMGDRVDLNVHYIGREQDGELTSMHGEDEVKGNILQLCAKDIGDKDTWLAFVKCQNESWQKIPNGWEECAKSAKLDEAKMGACLDGEQGKKLLGASFAVSNEKKATGSPTIFLAGERYQGGRSEASFSRAICGAMKEPKAAYCKEIPESVKVPVTVVSDKRCQGRGCDARGFLAFVSRSFEGAQITNLDYSDPKGKELFEKSGQKFLPIAVFGPSVEKEEEGYKRLKMRLTKMEGSDDLVFPLGRKWDPAAEVCDDGKDNTGNGKVDCDDDSCSANKICRTEKNNKIDLFIMSQCPYGALAGNAMEEVLKNFKNNKKKIDFEINFIGNESGGKLMSMHGQPEVDEDLRQICAQKIYGKKYKFMDYVLCRNQDYKSPDWQSCAKGGISAAAIKKCAEGDEGKQLLTASFKKAGDLGIGGSPTWLLNNKYDMRGRDPEAIKKAFCDKNAVAGCDAKLTAGPAPGAKRAPAGGGCGPTGAK